jgi:hypothetical protein
MKTSTALRRVLVPLAIAAILHGPMLPHIVAERLPEKRETASHVIVGVVDAVFERRTKEHRQFIVRIRVTQVEKGDGIAAGQFFHAYCFQRRAFVRMIPGEGGHRAIPAEGQRIKAFVHYRSGRSEGNYPDWFDALEDE